jgi:hypothetical protein
MSWFKKKVIKKLVISRPSQELVEPTAEEVRGWMGMGVGKYHQAQLIEKLEDIKDNWVNGDYTGNSTEETAQLNAEALGKAQAYADIILTLEEMKEDDEEEIED